MLIYGSIFKILLAWPEPNHALMHSPSLFSLKHFGALVLNIFMGMIFGFESFISNLQSSGKWHIDIKRLLIIGLPSLLFSVEFVRFFLLNSFLSNIGMSTFYLIAPATEPFFRFIFGYTVLTSIYKK